VREIGIALVAGALSGLATYVTLTIMIPLVPIH